jgi:ankyrin repeat protein
MAFFKPFGLCAPIRSDEMPFIGATLGGYSADSAEAVRLMIAAGVDVNEASPDGLLPLRNAVRSENEVVVKMLLSAGADPIRRPEKDTTGDFDNALDVAAKKPRTPAAIRIEEMLRAAGPPSR